MIEAEDILEVMRLPARSVCKKVYPQNRPRASVERLTEFIVVSLPYSESNKTVGEDDDYWLDETVVFEIYVADSRRADNPNEMNTKRMKTLRGNLKALFPIVDDEGRFKIVCPRTVVNGSSDGNGYHYSRVQAKMTTMV